MILLVVNMVKYMKTRSPKPRPWFWSCVKQITSLPSSLKNCPQSSNLQKYDQCRSLLDSLQFCDCPLSIICFSHPGHIIWFDANLASILKPVFQSKLIICCLLWNKECVKCRDLLYFKSTLVSLSVGYLRWRDASKVEESWDKNATKTKEGKTQAAIASLLGEICYWGQHVI